MMHKLIFISAILLLGGCCSESLPPMGGNGESVPLSISGLHLEGSVQPAGEFSDESSDGFSDEPAGEPVDEPSTRVTAGAVTTDGALVRVFRLGTNGYKAQYNVKCTYKGAENQWQLAEVIGIDKRNTTIAGVYDPNGVGAFLDGNTSFQSSANLTAQVFDETKLWYVDNSHTAVTNAAPAVAFKMTPAYSRLVLQVERDASYKGDCKITEVTLLSGGKFYNNLPMDIATGTLQGSSSAYNATSNPLLKNDAGFVTIASGTKNIDLLLPPQSIQSGGLALSLKIDGEVLSVTIPYASLPKLAMGSQYNLPLRVQDFATLTISSSVTEQAWSATSDMGTITDSSGI